MLVKTISINKYQVTKCQNKSESFRDKIEIFPVGVNEALIVELDVVCDCECDQEPVVTRILLLPIHSHIVLFN